MDVFSLFLCFVRLNLCEGAWILHCGKKSNKGFGIIFIWAHFSSMLLPSSAFACPLHWHNLKNRHFAVCAVWTAHRVAHMWTKIWLTFQQIFQFSFLFLNATKQTENGFMHRNNVTWRGWHVKGWYSSEDKGDGYLNPFQSNFFANRILPSFYLFWAVKRLVDYL
jgi:hypothetical protein